MVIQSKSGKVVIKITRIKGNRKLSMNKHRKKEKNVGNSLSLTHRSNKGRLKYQVTRY